MICQKKKQVRSEPDYGNKGEFLQLPMSGIIQKVSTHKVKKRGQQNNRRKVTQGKRVQPKKVMSLTPNFSVTIFLLLFIS